MAVAVVCLSLIHSASKENLTQTGSRACPQGKWASGLVEYCVTMAQVPFLCPLCPHTGDLVLHLLV